MDDERDVQCPYCFEWMLLYIDPGTSGTFIQDCEVCCRPWQVAVQRDHEGAPHIRVQRAQ